MSPRAVQPETCFRPVGNTLMSTSSRPAPSPRRHEAVPDALPVGPPPPDVVPVDARPSTPPDVVPVEPWRKTPKQHREEFIAFLKLFPAGVEWCFGLLCLPLVLAVLATIPLLQLLTLGYLLEAAGRVGKTGWPWKGLIGVRHAARVGGIALAVGLFLLPLWLVSKTALDAELIDPGGAVARNWRVGLVVGTVLVGLHLALALACDGRLRYFFVPFLAPVVLVWRIIKGGYYAKCRDGVWEFVRPPRLWAYAWLGMRGFAGAFLWLVVPITMLALGRDHPVIGFLGAALLAGVLVFLPFLQVHFAVRNDLRAYLDVPGVVWRYFHAPWAFTLALILTLTFALPLYLLKIEMIPREAAWLPGLVFIAFILPARLVAGWAYACAEHRIKKNPLRFNRFGRVLSWLFFSATGALPVLPAAAFYVLIVFFTQYTSWHGVWSLYEQHAFLLPVPFLGM